MLIVLHHFYQYYSVGVMLINTRYPRSYKKSSSTQLSKHCLISSYTRNSQSYGYYSYHDYYWWVWVVWVTCACILNFKLHNYNKHHAYIRVNTGFTFAPESQNITVGGTAQFICECTDGDVVWRIDGQSANDVNIVTASQGGVYTLTMINVQLTYNGSEIQCRAMFDDSRDFRFTSPAILQLQGIRVCPRP